MKTEENILREVRHGNHVPAQIHHSRHRFLLFERQWPVTARTAWPTSVTTPAHPGSAAAH